jgi:presenilin 1
VQGLSGTLALLAIFRKALPALPISIFLGVVVYLLTRTIVVPYITELTLNGVFM